MTPVTDRSFGLLIGYVIPGFAAIVLWGSDAPLVAAWMAIPSTNAATVGGFLYVTIASVAAGLVLGMLRWAILDRLHHATGLNPPAWRPISDPVSLDAYRSMVDLHYRYYEFYGSSLLLILALLFAPPDRLSRVAEWRSVWWGLLVLSLVFYAASRDALSRCYARFPGDDASFAHESERNLSMTNGGPRHEETPPAGNASVTPETRTAAKPTSVGAAVKPSADGAAGKTGGEAKPAKPAESPSE